MNRYHQRNMCGTLRSVMLGTFFYPEFFSTIRSDRVREPLMRVADEIQEDLDYFHRILIENGVGVIRAKQPLGRFGEIDHRINSIAVRDNHVVVGDQLIQLQKNDYVLDPLRSYCDRIVDLSEDNTAYFEQSMRNAVSNFNPINDTWYSRKKYLELAGTSWPPYEDYVSGIWRNDPERYACVSDEMKSFAESMQYYTQELMPLQGPNVLNFNDRIIVDSNEYADYARWLSERINDDRRVEQITTRAGHTDGVFMPLNDDTALGITEVLQYLNMFGDNIIGIPENAYQNHIHEFKLMKDRVQGRWWIPGQEENQELIEFTESVLSSWTGRAEESVFDVNVLVLDQQTVMINRIDDIVVPQLSKHGIDYILVPWRHRFFVDNGLHCITLDLDRDD